MRIKNIFHDIPEQMPDELFEILLEGRQMKVERIVSRGHASEQGFWYDSPIPEWVILLKGSATLSIEGKSDPVVLKPGDYLNIPAHVRHRVDKTHATRETIWLAIFYRPGVI
ncbi:MAG: cupin domain-containing protein [Desulfobacterales bacterium]|nr:cupin domain-containing protein [Desulfobacterales bacterium]